MKTKTLNKKVQAFTLMEVLIALAIVGIAVLLAYPQLKPLISSAKSKEAQLQLKHLHGQQEQYFFIHSKYSPSLEEVNFEHSKLVSEGGNANYVIEVVESSNTGFLATATSITDFDGDGQLNKWQVDHEMNLKEVQKD